MAYAQTIKVGSSTVVIGFEPPSIDPVATHDVVGPILALEKVHIDHEQLKADLTACLILQQEIWTAWKTQTKGTAAYLESKRNWDEQVALQAKIQEQCRIQSASVEQMRRSLVVLHAVRFTTSGVEEIDDATKDVLATKLATLAPDTRLLLDGTTVIDKIGDKYWTKTVDTWAETEISELNTEIPEGSFKWNDLDKAQVAEIEDQINRERIAAMTPEARTAEKDGLIAKALMSASLKKGEFEIMGSEDPLAASQEWYAARVAEIEERYTIS